MQRTTAAFISLIGRPNVGKSSLLNRVLGQKVAIVSDKPQTTRNRIMGVYHKGPAELVFIDTPGFHRPKNKLDEQMMKAAQSGLADVDAVTLVVEAAPKFKFDPNHLPPAELALMAQIKQRRLPAILAINKIDLLPQKDALLPLIAAYSAQCEFKAVVPFSAKTGDGVPDLVAEQMAFAKPSPHYFDDDTSTDLPDRVMVGEIIREKILRNFDKEIPHGTAVDVETFYERDNKDGEPILEVSAVIYCEKENHKGILVGKNGQMLKKVGTSARIDIERFFGCKVNLKLWVKVKEGWRDKQGVLHSLGLDFKE